MQPQWFDDILFTPFFSTAYLHAVKYARNLNPDHGNGQSASVKTHEKQTEQTFRCQEKKDGLVQL